MIICEIIDPDIKKIEIGAFKNDIFSDLSSINWHCSNVILYSCDNHHNIYLQDWFHYWNSSIGQLITQYVFIDSWKFLILDIHSGVACPHLISQTGSIVPENFTKGCSSHFTPVCNTFISFRQPLELSDYSFAISVV